MKSWLILLLFVPFLTWADDAAKIPQDTQVPHAEQKEKNALLDVKVDSVSVELASVSEATNKLAESMQALSNSLTQLSQNANLSEEDKQRLSEMIDSATQLTVSVNGLKDKLPSAEALPKMDQSLAGIATSVESISGDILGLLAQYPAFVENTDHLLNNPDHTHRISVSILDGLMWKLVTMLIIVLAIVLLVAVGLPMAFIYGFIVVPKKAMFAKMDKSDPPALRS